MTVPVQMMKAATAGGLSAVCSTCVRYWEARDRGIPGDACLGHACGSPIAGDDFHNYKGAMTDEAFAKFCFVCGDPATNHVRVVNRHRQIGVCDAHLKMLVELKAEGAGQVPPILVRKEGELVPVTRLVKPMKRLIDVIIETEMEWAEQDGREFKVEDLLKP